VDRGDLESDDGLRPCLSWLRQLLCPDPVEAAEGDGGGEISERRAEDRLIGLLVVAALAVALVVAVVNWLLAHWWILAVVGVLAVLAGGGWLYQKQQQARWEATRAQGLRYGLSQLDALHHSRFEDADAP
jgi:hypothetical protein